jgi:hypothetical protein
LEFVEGILIERGIPTIAHSILQKLLLLYFAQYESVMGFVALPILMDPEEYIAYRF